MSLIVSRLCFGYKNQPVLQDISLEIPKGRFSVLLGPNGSGKSTLLKLMAGQLPFASGSIFLEGEDLTKLSPRLRARTLGYLPQMHSPVFPFTVDEVVLTGRASYIYSSPSQKDRDKTLETLEATGLLALRHRPYTELSGGERQLVMLARLLAQEASILLLDEPVSHLDLANTHHLLSLVKQWVESGRTVLAVLHDPNTAFLFGDHFFFLKKGVLQLPMDPRRPWQGHFLDRLYDIQLETIPHGDRAVICHRLSGLNRVQD